MDTFFKASNNVDEESTFNAIVTLETQASVVVVVVRDGDGGWMRRAMVGCDGGEAEMEVKMRNRS